MAKQTSNTKILFIVESPNKCKHIQEYLGSNYIVKATVGHVCDLAKGGNNGIGIDVTNNFKCKYVLDVNKKKVVEDLIEASQKVGSIILATDPDREGEAISNHIKNYLASSGKKMKRVTFHEITKAAIEKALKSPRDIDTNLVDSQEARRVLDRIVGFMASPYIMSVFGPHLSAGRTQSAALRLIVDREKEIKSFIPDEFWTIGVNLSKDNIQSFEVKYDGKVKTKAEADILKKLLSTDTFTVTDVISKTKKEYPPPPFTTAKIQQLASKKLGLSADQTMATCQSLFETGMITYHRTDSVRVSDEALKDLRDYLKTNNLSHPKKAYDYKNKDTAAGAHECIRPTDMNNTPKKIPGSDTEKKLYKLIFDTYVASQMEAATFDTLEVKVISDKSKHTFKSTGKALKDKGFLEVAGYTADAKIDIPNLVVKDKLALFGKLPITAEQKFTQPLPRYNEASLVKELEDKRIGRSSTYASIVTKISDRKYVEKKGTTYYPTDLGISILDKLKDNFDFANIDYSALMEDKLDAVAEGKVKQVDMLTEFYDNFKKQLDKAYIDNGGDLCDKCSAPMVTRVAKKTGKKFLGCSKWPKCNGLKNI